MSSESTLLGGRNCTRESRLASTSSSDESRSSESNLINRRNLTTLSLSSSNALHTSHLSHNLLSLLILDNLSLYHFLYLRIAQVAETDAMNLIQNNYQQVVVVTTLVHWRNLTLLAIEDPLQSVTGRMDVSNIVSSCSYILQLLYTITILLSILQEILSLRISTYEARELVVSCAVGIVRELNLLLDNCSHILINHSLAVANLEDDITLTQLNLVQCIHRSSIQCVDEGLVVLIHGLSILILLGCHPSLLTCLTILLSDSLEVCTSSESTMDRVCLCLSLSL